MERNNVAIAPLSAIQSHANWSTDEAVHETAGSGSLIGPVAAPRIGETKAVLGAPQLDITSSTAKFGSQHAPNGLRDRQTNAARAAS